LVYLQPFVTERRLVDGLTGSALQLTTATHPRIP